MRLFWYFRDQYPTNQSHSSSPTQSLLFSIPSNPPSLPPQPSENGYHPLIPTLLHYYLCGDEEGVETGNLKTESWCSLNP